MSTHENKMIAIKPAGEMDPAMRLALKNHIIRKRQQSKQELEQDAIEKRLKREKEAKRKQDAMTLDQLKEQLSHLEKKIDNLKNEKHTLFAQLKQTVPCEPPRKKINTNQQQATATLPTLHSSSNNNNNNINVNNINSQSTAPSSPTPSNISQHQPIHLQQQHAQQPIQLKQTSSPFTSTTTPPTNQTVAGQLAPPPLQPPPPPLPPHSLHNSQSLNVAQLSSSPAPPPGQPSPQSFAPHQPQSTPIQLAPHMTNHYLYPGLPPNLGPQNVATSAAAAATMQANLLASQQNLMRTPPPQNLNSMFNQAAFSHILNAHNFRGQSPHLAQLSHQQRPSNPYNSPMGPYSQLGHPAQSPLISGHGIPTSIAHAHRSSPLHVRPSPPPQMQGGNPPPVSSAGGLNKMPSLNLPPIPTSVGGSINFNPSNLSNSSNSDEPPRKKVHTGQSGPPQQQQQQPPQLQHQQCPPPPFQNQLSVAGLQNPYLYAGLPPGLGGAVSAANGAASLQQNLLASQNLMRTPPPNINAFFNSAAFSQILNAHNFRGQSPYLAQLAQQHQVRPPNSYSSPMSPFGHVQLGAGGHPGGPSSLLSGHGIPTSMSHSMPQSISLMRPSSPPPQQQQQQQIPGNVTPLNSAGGAHRMPPLNAMQSMPVTSSGQLDFSNPNLAQQYRQAAAAAALGLPFMPPYFNSNNFL